MAWTSLAELRRSKGLTQAELGQRISPGSRSKHVHVSMVERGRRFLGPRARRLWAEALGVDVELISQLDDLNRSRARSASHVGDPVTEPRE